MGRSQSAAKPDDAAGTNDETAAAKDESGQPISNGQRNLWINETALATAPSTSPTWRSRSRSRDRRRCRPHPDWDRTRASLPSPSSGAIGGNATCRPHRSAGASKEPCHGHGDGSRGANLSEAAHRLVYAAFPLVTTRWCAVQAEVPQQREPHDLGLDHHRHRGCPDHRRLLRQGSPVVLAEPLRLDVAGERDASTSLRSPCAIGSARPESVDQPVDTASHGSRGCEPRRGRRPNPPET